MLADRLHTCAVHAMHESIIAKLEEAGIEIHYKPDYGREEVINAISDYQILIVRSKTPIDKEIIEHFVRKKIPYLLADQLKELFPDLFYLLPDELSALSESFEKDGRIKIIFDSHDEIVGIGNIISP